MERGLDLLDIYTGRLSFRRLRIVLDHLPPESRFKTALYEAQDPEERAEADASEPTDDESHGPWSLTQQLLAQVADNTATLIWLKTNPKKGSKPPKPIPRPGVSEPTRRVKPHVIAHLQAIRTRHAERHDPAE